MVPNALAANTAAMAVLPASLLEILLMVKASCYPWFCFSFNFVCALLLELRAAQRTLLWWRDLHPFNSAPFDSVGPS
jgi:hypothetical protein